jgi:squalene-associated FAD-dependent desaturase
MDNGAPVAIIGGGYAGCAAAVTLAGKGLPCVLYETAPVLGGRARRVERDGLMLDNGQHLLLGAYARTLELLESVHDKPAAQLLRRPLAIAPFAPDQRDALTLLARRAPGRLGMLVGLLAASGLSLRERLANLRWFRATERSGFVRPPGETVAQFLAPLPPRVARLLWEPLNLAALNTPASQASAQVFANVLRAAFAGRGEDSDFVFNATDLSAFFPEAAARFVRARGGAIRTDTRAQVINADGVAAMVACEDKAVRARAAIVAVGGHQLAHAFAPEALVAHPPLAAAIDALQLLAFEAIVTIWLGYGSTVAMPGPLARLDDAPGQWVIDRPDILARAQRGGPALAQLLAVMISANGPHLTLPHDALVAATDAQLRRLAPSLPPCTWSFVISEKRATYACTPQRARPAGPRFAPGIYLAGDYVDSEFPATLEAAVRSGVAAAEALLADARRT